jgi:hypothetical protein
MASKMGAGRSGGVRGHLRRFGLIHLILGAVIVAGVGSLLVYDRLKQRDTNVATAQAWDIKGEPCPSLTAEEWAARHLSAPKSFDYDGDTLARWAGDASCSDVRTKGGTGLGVFKVCQFAAPVSISVKTKGRDFYFNTGVGQAATVVIQDGKARCVLGGKFTLKSEMGG